MALPIIEDLLLKAPLYEKFQVSSKDGEMMFNLQYFNRAIDLYCRECKKDSTFRGVNEYKEYEGDTVVDIYYSYKQFEKDYHSNPEEMERIANPKHRLFTITLQCSRNNNHKAYFTFYKLNNELIKIGQYPSIASLDEEKLKKYRTILTESQYSELNRGIGLTAHGVGIGAFVYLRRIFEDLIFEAYQKARSENSINSEDFEGKRMDEKIGLLKEYLPKFLVKNKSIYGILSKGIHELRENECLEYFPVVKAGIELILDEKIVAYEKEKKQAEIEQQLASIHSKLKQTE